MDAVIAVLFMVALVGGWWFLQFTVSGGRMWTAPWLAFSATGVAVLFAMAGLIGYPLGRQGRFAGESLAGQVIWPQVAIGVVAGLIAVYFWRRALGARTTPAAHNRN